VSQVYGQLLEERLQYTNKCHTEGREPSPDTLSRLELLLAAEAPTPELCSEWVSIAVATMRGPSRKAQLHLVEAPARELTEADRDCAAAIAQADRLNKLTEDFFTQMAVKR
jgi:hypothetical protein